MKPLSNDESSVNLSIQLRLVSPVSVTDVSGANWCIRSLVSPMSASVSIVGTGESTCELCVSW